MLKPIFHSILLIPMNKISKSFMPIFGEHVSYYSQETNTATPIGRSHIGNIGNIDQNPIPFDWRCSTTNQTFIGFSWKRTKNCTKRKGTVG